MIDFDVANLTDAQLVLCCDEYIDRVVAQSKALKSESTQIMVICFNYNYHDNYTVDHDLEVSFDGKTEKLKSNNLFTALDECYKRAGVQALHAPRERTLAIAAPKETIEEAEFDDVPY